jgi:transmembrane 9 superfamily protein 3
LRASKSGLSRFEVNTMQAAFFFRLVVFYFCLLLVSSGDADERTHRYKDGEEVILWVNKVGPYHNPHEKYEYYSLPFCQPKRRIETRFEGLGEALEGYELIKSDIQIKFKQDVKETLICGVPVTKKEIQRFRDAIKEDYFYELFLDDLPIFGMVGVYKPDKDEYYLYMHQRFTITYNGDRIIEVKVSTERPKLLHDHISVLEFTYSVHWLPTQNTFERRFDRYLDDKFFEHQIHWFSIFNSFMLLIFLVGVVSLILLRTLKKDFARYAQHDSEGDEEDPSLDVGDDSGWKQIHGDVFRAPSHLTLFTSLLGTGVQLLVLVFVTILMAVWFYQRRGTIVTAFIFCYALTSIIGGFVGTSFYTQYGGKTWWLSSLCTALLFPGVVLIGGFLLNFIAWGYGSLTAIPFATVAVMMGLWMGVTLPLTFVGALIGVHFNGTPNFPCRINPVPRPLNSHDKFWYQHRWVHVILTGILPFGSIFVEMYFVFTAFWQHKYYYVFGFMMLVFIILVVVTACVTIVSTYFLLNSEDYRWHWTAFLAAASTGVYVYLYAIYYFHRSRMSGFLQTMYFFGYMALFCFGLAVLCGTIGYLGSYLFVRKIYQHVKID